jgi:hypothetical protein
MTQLIIGRVQHDCDKCKAQAENNAELLRTVRVLQAKLSEIEKREPADGTWHDMYLKCKREKEYANKLWEAGKPFPGYAAPVQQPADAPSGFVLVPLRPTRAMEEVFQQEDWEWADVLAAAEAVTEDKYWAALESDTQQPAEALTNEQIKEKTGASDEYWAQSKLFILGIARAIEAAHGIHAKEQS